MITTMPPVRVERVMGTAVTFHVRDRAVAPSTLDPVVAFLHWVDATFSVYRPESEISRIGDGHLPVGRAHPAVRAVLASCERLGRDTRRSFDHRPEAGLDPSGYVKGWAVEQAAGMVAAAGVGSFLVSAGGDVAVRNEASDPAPWSVGIRDPNARGSIVGAVNVRDGAVATSGSYEQGDHIWNAGAGLASVSVVGPDLGVADALATAIFACGIDDIAWLNEFPGCDLVAVTSDRRVLTSPAAPFAAPEAAPH